MSALYYMCAYFKVAKAWLLVGSMDVMDVKLGMHKYIRGICRRERRWPVEQFSLFHVLRTLILNFKTSFFWKKRDIFNGLTTLKCSNIIILSLLCILAPGSSQVVRTELTSFFLLADITDLRAGAEAVDMKSLWANRNKTKWQNESRSLGHSTWSMWEKKTSALSKVPSLEQ